MDAFTQADRLARIDTPLGEDKLLLLGMSGSEGVSQLFHYTLDLASEDGKIAFQDILGKPATVTLHLQGGEVRYFNGIVSKFSHGETDERLTYYRAELVPWLWFLTRAADCRIFQEKKIPEVIEEIFRDAGFQDFELKLSASYDKWEYCVEYRETHFNFVCRLMEQYGIHYFFKHERTKHVLVLADSKSVNEPCPHQPTANFEPMQDVVTESDIVESWEVEQVLQPGKYALTDFDFKKPKNNLLSNVNSVVNVGGNEALEIFDFPGEYEERSVGEKVTKIRMEEEEAIHRVYTGSTTCRAFQSGYRFKLTGHEMSELNQDYLITSVHHSISGGAGFRSGGHSEVRYSNHVACIPYSVPFRPRRLTPKPVIQGIQTAVVVGPSGEEIHTDKYGRIKVQFHWDRRGKYDDKSSCWIRVAQIWAGKKWGAVFLPRIGQEVVVSFMEGDPDQPLVIGSVYNDESMPPYGLPGEMTKSTIKSYSSKGGGGFNEIRFEDKKGKEQVFVHAEKEMDIRVKNDRREWIGRDRHLFVKRDKREKIERDVHSITKRDCLTKIDRDNNLIVGGKQAIKITGSNSLSVTGDVIEEFKANHSEQTTGNVYVKGMQVVIEGMTGLTIKVGGNFLTINPAGIQMQGTMVMINSGGSALSGSPGSLVPPAAPEEAEIADNADPGSKEPTYEAQRAEMSPMKLATLNAPSHGGAESAADSDQKEDKKHWVAIELVDQEGKPVPGVKYAITLPDGTTMAPGTTDDKGKARVDGIDPGTCKVTFPDLDKDAWKPK